MPPIVESSSPSSISSDRTMSPSKGLADFFITEGNVDERRNSVVSLVEQLDDGQIEMWMKQITEALLHKTSAASREGACLVIVAVCEKFGVVAEPYILALLTPLLDCYADKKMNVRGPAEAAAKSIVTLCNPNAVKMLLPILFNGIDRSKKWQTKLGSLHLMAQLAASHPTVVATYLPDLIPMISDCMWDTRPEIKVCAEEVMTKVCSVAANPDIEAFIPAMISCIARPSEVAECVHKLAATTFVTTVESPALAIMEPLLVRGLTEAATSVRRQAAVIIDNMCKLVEDPAEARLFLPKILPGLQKVIDTAADPDCRKVATRAHQTLFRAGGEIDVDAMEQKEIVYEDVLASMKATLPKKHAIALPVVHYVAGLCQSLMICKNFQNGEWNRAIAPFFSSSLHGDELGQFIKAFLNKCRRETISNTATEEDVDDDGEDLCDCEFSLAYGGMILLNNARLHLKRGKRYGLCGPNGAGKSTLMRAISNGQLDGFPSKDELRTVYVEHSFQASEADLPVVKFIHADQSLAHLEESAIVKALSDVGFTSEMQAQAISSLSGGWKMKLELARAMLMNADILLLDEPTNHLDVSNVKWLEQYLVSQTNVTSMIVSHDSGFLDTVCTNIIHYESRKLKSYKGNLSELVKVRPEAKSYYALEAATIKFKFPEPGFLADIKNKGKPILRMYDCAFKYPGRDNFSISGVTISASLASRIAVVGPNGAGKSTMIKLLTGENEPTTGNIWKHPNMRFAYVAQHAFHHLEDHLDITPNQYIQWRFQSGEDKELLAKSSRQISAEEKEILKQVINYDGQKRVIEEISSRRKLKKTFEYEVKWIGMPETENSWIPRDRLERWGLEKFLQRTDDREAARANLMARPLTAGVIQKHLDDFGLEEAFGTHSRMRGLSGGQKVKVVLAAAMWQNPHILVLDEPTNYLDRDSLGALVGAIKEFGGGVVMISHNNEFTSSVCTETWHVNQGLLTIEGDVPEDKTKIEFVQEEESVDAFGNVVKNKIQKGKLTRKERKAKEKRKKEALARGEDPSSSEED